MVAARLLHDLARAVHDVARGATDEHRRLRERLATAVLATLVVDVLGTAAIYALEHGAKRSDISSVWQACFWTTAQLLTVSSSLRNPVTPGGQAVDLVLELWSIVVVTAVAGSFAAFFHRSSR